jgi:hypothetical protein
MELLQQPESWLYKPVQEAVTDRLDARRRRQEKQKEAKLQQQSVIQLIDTGYKVLATRLHPDKGGSHEGMARLNRARDILKGAI